MEERQDLINRQAAIDELDKGAWGVEWDKALAKTMIESLPSAQPQKVCVAEIQLKIDDIKDYIDKAINSEMIRIMTLPSVQPERKKGYWHDRYVESMGMVATVCSECGYPCSQIPMKYCANCGADMREVDNERPDRKTDGN